MVSRRLNIYHRILRSLSYQPLLSPGCVHYSFSLYYNADSNESLATFEQQLLLGNNTRYTAFEWRSLAARLISPSNYVLMESENIERDFHPFSLISA